MNRQPPEPSRRVSAKHYRPAGLGDLVHAVAQPIARAIDRVAGTRISTCSACAKRRAALNRAVPFTTPPDQP